MAIQLTISALSIGEAIAIRQENITAKINFTV